MDNVVLIINENKSFNVVTNVQKASIPYFNQLRTTGVWQTGKTTNHADAQNYLCAGSPSAPNYLALTCGRLLQNGSDGWNPYGFQNIVDLMTTAGVSWGGYMENLPSNWTAHPNAGLYVFRHNPFCYYTDITGDSTRTPHVKDYTTFVPGAERFQWITPNLTDDGHTSSPNSVPLQLANNDAWLKTEVPKILNSAPFAAGKNAVLIILWDEGNASPNQVCCVFLGPGAKTVASSVAYNHYSLLATLENMLGLSNLGQNDAGAKVMSDMFGATGGGTNQNTAITNQATSSERFVPASNIQSTSYNPDLAFSAISSETFSPSSPQGTTTISPVVPCGTLALPAGSLF